MAGYFQHIAWPAVNEEALPVLTKVGQSDVSFYSGGGVWLIHYSVHYRNNSAAEATVATGAFLDGVQLDADNPGQQVPNTDDRIINRTFLATIPEGIHVLDVRLQGMAAAGEGPLGGPGILIGIELPSWEVGDRIEGP